MRFLTLIRRNLFQRKVRSALTCLGMGVAVCAIVTMLGVADVFEQAVTQLFSSRDVDLIVTRAGAAQRASATLEESIAERIRKLQGVATAEGMLVDVVSFVEANMIAVYVMGWSPDGMMMNNLKISQGRKLQPGTTREVLLGSVLATNLTKTLGDKIEIEGEEFTVVGIHDSPNMFERSMAIVSLKDLQEFMDRKEQVNAFLIKLEPDAKKEAAIQTLQTAIADLRDDQDRKLGIAVEQTEAHVQSTLELKVVRGMSWSTSIIALVIGVIGMLNTMMISVFERTREIGILRAIGWRKSWIVWMIIAETVVLAVLGSLLGVLMSLGLTFALATFPSMSQLIIPTHVSVVLMGKAMLMAIVAGVIGALYPALVASRLLPTEALRHD